MNQREIAKLAGVSSATVSRVINDDPKVSSETKKKVLQVVEQYSYVTNANARSLRLSHSKAIGFLISNFNNPIFIAMYQGLEPLCRKKGYNIIIGNTNEDVAQENDAVDLFLGYQVAGIIGCFVNQNEMTIRKLKHFEKNIVAIDRRAKGLTTDTVEIDNKDGARQQVRYLASLGHEKIAVIHGTTYDTPGEERLKGYYDEMKAQQIEVQKEYVVSGEFNEHTAYYAAIELLQSKEPPTAIIAHNNVMCMGAYKAIKDMKKTIPEDISLIGFDEFDFSDYLNPSITLVERSIRQMGELAAKMIIDRIEGEYSGEARNMILPIKLRIMESCSVPKQLVR